MVVRKPDAGALAPSELATNDIASFWAYSLPKLEIRPTVTVRGREAQRLLNESEVDDMFSIGINGEMRVRMSLRCGHGSEIVECRFGA